MLRGAAIAVAAALLAACLSPLHHAAANGDVREIKRLIASGVSPDVVNESLDRWTPMNSAIWAGQAAAVQALLDAGADPFFSTALGTPRQVAAKKGRADIVALIDRAAQARRGGALDAAAAGAQAGIAGALSAPFPRGIVGLALGATKDGTIVVSSVVPGTSAAEAGFQAGDRIVAVGDKSVQTMTLNQAVGLMRGAPGTTVDVTYRRGEAEPIMTSLTRQPPPAQAAAALAQPPSAAAGVDSDVDRVKATGAERPDDFALVIGIEEYQSVPRAEYGVRDAETARRHFAAMGIPQRNIVALEGNAATGNKLKSYLQEWLPLNVNERSTLWVYYSGHGAPDPKSGDAYLVPWDGDPKFLKSTAYPLKQFYADLTKTKAKRVVVALDSCFSGAGGRSVLAEGTRPLVVKVEDGAPRTARLTVLAAASGDETTGTLNEQGHGAFTYFFFKGLSGAATGAGGGVTPKALFDYLKPRVQDEAHRQNREQTPTLIGGTDADPL